MEEEVEEGKGGDSGDEEGEAVEEAVDVPLHGSTSLVGEGETLGVVTFLCWFFFCY